MGLVTVEVLVAFVLLPRDRRVVGRPAHLSQGAGAVKRGGEQPATMGQSVGFALGRPRCPAQNKTIWAATLCAGVRERLPASLAVGGVGALAHSSTNLLVLLVPVVLVLVELLLAFVLLRVVVLLLVVLVTVVLLVALVLLRVVRLNPVVFAAVVVRVALAVARVALLLAVVLVTQVLLVALVLLPVALLLPVLFVTVALPMALVLQRVCMLSLGSQWCCWWR